MIVYSWPPRAGVGMLRSLKFAKYLPEFGWEPTILTPEDAPSQIYCKKEEGNLPRVRVITTRYCDIISNVKKKLRSKPQMTISSKLAKSNINDSPIRKKIISRIIALSREFLSIPDENIGWYRPGVKKGLKLLRDNNFDIIYSTSPPETSHLIAKKLKKISGLPWIADLRDPWSGYYHPINRPKLKHLLNNKIEKVTLKYSDYIITVSNTLATRLKRLHKINTSVITNGFDEEDFQKIDDKNVLSNRKFTLIYTGKIHKKKQNLASLFASIRELIEERKIDKADFVIKFYAYGSNLPDFNVLRRKYGLDSVLSYFPPVDYKECLRKLKDSNLLLLVGWNGDDEISRGVLGVKIYDYLGAKRPILTISSRKNSELCKIIRETNTGCICSSKDEVKQALFNYYRAFKENRFPYTLNEEMINKYTRYNLTKQLTDILNICIDY